MPLTVGTAGHIDHGKTWLVRALTGKDTDRLPEEQRRGISIDLGYAPLELPDGRRLSLVDVPGHERFVRNMVAGATGIDLFLLVIDAGEGARPQTHEHLAILRLLGIEHGVVAVTKADAVDAETLELALEEARELVPEAEVVAVSAKTGAGPRRAARALGAPADLCSGTQLGDEPARLYVDRVFTLRGIGTVATGTLWSGSIGEGDVLRAEPADATCASAASRCTTARSSAPRPGSASRSRCRRRARELRRGDALVAPGASRRATGSTSRSRSSEPIADGAACTSTTARGRAGTRRPRGGAFAQLRLAAPVVAARGDRVVLRGGRRSAAAPCSTPSPPRHADPAGSSGSSAARSPVHAPVLVDGAGSLLGGWLAELGAELERGSTPPIRSTRGPAPSEPWAKDVLAAAVERRGSELYRPGAERVARRARGPSAARSRPSSRPSPARPRRSRTRARPLPRARRRLVRLGDGYARLAAAYERAALVVARSARRRADHARALPRPRRLRPPRRAAPARALDADGVTRRVGDERVLRAVAPRRRTASSSAGAARVTAARLGCGCSAPAPARVPDRPPPNPRRSARSPRRAAAEAPRGTPDVRSRTGRLDLLRLFDLEQPALQREDGWPRRKPIRNGR